MIKRLASAALLILAGFAVGIAWPYVLAPKPVQPTPAAFASHSSGAPLPQPPSQLQPDAPGKSRSRSELILDECLTLAKTDIAAAFNKISGITPESYQSRLREGLATKLLRQDFSRAREISRLMKRSLEFQSALAMTVGTALKSDPDRTMEIIKTQLTGEYRNEAFRFAAQAQVGQKDFEAAAATLNAMPISNERDQVLVNIAGSIGEAGIEQSLKWLSQLQAEKERTSARSWIVEHFKEKNDTLALKRLLEVTTDAETRKQLLTWIALRMGTVNPQAARDYVDSHSGPERDYAANCLIVSELVNDPGLPFGEKVKRATAFDNQEMRSIAIERLVSSETKHGPENMARTVMALPDESKPQVVGAFARAWVSVDADGASEWVRNLPDGKVKDTAISGLARHLSLMNRSRAREVAAWVNDPDLREKLLKSLSR